MEIFEKFKLDIKRDFLSRILVALRNGNWTRNEARIFSRLLIGILGMERESDVMSGLSKISQSKPETLTSFLRKATEYEVKRNIATLEKVRKSLANISIKITPGGGEM